MSENKDDKDGVVRLQRNSWTKTCAHTHVYIELTREQGHKTPDSVVQGVHGGGVEEGVT